MKRKLLLAVCLTGFGLISAQAQDLGFSIGGHVPSPGAALDINAKNKGVLLPRIELSSEGIHPSKCMFHNIM
ncbi:hypothetical protein HX039_18345 [Myroides marinus]|uniref:hypothetical protein n=1 Tax=Myroides marinus TaxID=703342 RepID=UPI0025791F74|nr:hypothetical protein [Myroides marinus]MDM1406032.1 hypothetical protein [Myroides marinus]